MYNNSTAHTNDDVQFIRGRQAAFEPYGDIFKRLMDCILVLMTAPFVVPVVLMLMLVTAADGHSPLYSQMRVGRFGRHFRIWKLRTMVTDADKVMTEYLRNNADAACEWATTQKLKNDPRITPVGQILRKTSMDELPQLWNVLIGDMSLVGPRPMMPDQQMLYPGDEYYEMRPGITGTWQISDRNESSFAARAKFDAEYREQMSLKTDCEILAATVSVVMRGTGY